VMAKVPVPEKPLQHAPADPPAHGTAT